MQADGRWNPLSNGATGESLEELMKKYYTEVTPLARRDESGSETTEDLMERYKIRPLTPIGFRSRPESPETQREVLDKYGILPGRRGRGRRECLTS